MMKSLALDAIEESPRVNVRAGLDSNAVEEYAHAYGNGGDMPALVVFREKGSERYILADGKHRKAAAEKAGIKTLSVEVYEGDETDALHFALACNTEHGVRRTRYDLRKAFSQLMTNDKLCKTYSSVETKSQLMRVSQATFRRMQAEWRESPSQSAKQAEAKEAAIKRAGNRGAKPAPSNTSDSRPVTWLDKKSNGNGTHQLDDDSADFITALDVIATAKVDPEALVKGGHVSVRTLRKVVDRVWKMHEMLE
jgi:hypothetical protein